MDRQTDKCWTFYVHHLSHEPLQKTHLSRTSSFVYGIRYSSIFNTLINGSVLYPDLMSVRQWYLQVKNESHCSPEWSSGTQRQMSGADFILVCWICSFEHPYSGDPDDSICDRSTVTFGPRLSQETWMTVDQCWACFIVRIAKLHNDQ